MRNYNEISFVMVVLAMISILLTTYLIIKQNQELYLANRRKRLIELTKPEIVDSIAFDCVRCGTRNKQYLYDSILFVKHRDREEEK